MRCGQPRGSSIAKLGRSQLANRTRVRGCATGYRSNVTPAGCLYELLAAASRSMLVGQRRNEALSAPTVCSDESESGTDQRSSVEEDALTFTEVK